MDPNTALLPLCIALGVLGLILAVLLWIRGRRGRALQALGFAALPVGLYLTGLLRMLWDAVVAVARWASSVVFNTTIWTGFGLIGLAVVLWVVGGMVARRNHTRRAVEKAKGGGAVESPTRRGGAGAAAGATAVGSGSGTRPAAKASGAKGKAAADPEEDEIEAILRSRGIE
ncbi:hypothetical protein CGZ93_09565 [Enemella dayhoffiae]|uniref:Cellulose synthase n=1 Tax=Enemella dayhoffiae TaxID=2016507 RepID=A0A255H646_9ACTN|nr:hypothetical protein [Enemella dayhoffiae]OYO22134.1 hypothetical protein CGZ93_09565 [Enemella dayhoffiae]